MDYKGFINIFIYVNFLVVVVGYGDMCKMCYFVRK